MDCNMKRILSLSLAVLATALPLAADQALEPIGGQDELIQAWTIENLYKAASSDNRLSATVVAVTAGHGYHPTRLVATIWDDAPVEGEYGHSTTFDLGRVGGLEPPLRLEKVHDRLYRLPSEASVSDTFESAVLTFSYHLHLAEDGGLTRVVPTVVYSSFWDMDGSRMGLIASGPHRSIYYVEPKPGSTAVPGMLFFHGTVDGTTYRGKILDWRPGKEGGERRANIDGSAPVAEGEIQDGGRIIVLKSQSTEWKNGEHVPVGPKKTRILRLDNVAGPDR